MARWVQIHPLSPVIEGTFRERGREIEERFSLCFLASSILRTLRESSPCLIIANHTKFWILSLSLALRIATSTEIKKNCFYFFPFFLCPSLFNPPYSPGHRFYSLATSSFPHFSCFSKLLSKWKGKNLFAMPSCVCNSKIAKGTLKVFLFQKYGSLN